MNLQEFKKLNVPDCPGVYTFKKDGEFLYIGKATSLRERLRSYFNPDLIETRGQKIERMIKVADTIEFETADSVLEALIRETELIKKYMPLANSAMKDDKSFNYVVITEEEFPRVLIIRGRNIEKGADGIADARDESGATYKYIFGPYPHGLELREALKIVRKIFPYRDTCIPAKEQILMKPGRQPKPCFNATIGLCPGVCVGKISRADYLKTINNIRLFFSGKKGKIITELKKRMMGYAKKQEFEKANELKHTLFSLEHIQDVSMIRYDGERQNAKDLAKEARKNNGALSLVSDWSGEQAERQTRIESYDIAHMSGKDMVGVMCVMTDNEFDKSQYRKFIINDFNASNDTGALTEILRRRFSHREWKMPDVIVIDGGQAQLNAATAVVNTIFKEFEFEGYAAMVPYIVSVVKDDTHKAREILYAEQDEIFLNSVSNFIEKEEIIKLNAETHRFAITFHKKKRGENFISKDQRKDGKIG